MRRPIVIGTVLAVALATAGVADAKPGNDRGNPRPPGPNSIELQQLGTYSTGVFDESAAEIVVHDPATQRVYVVNANEGVVDVLDISDPTEITDLFSLQSAGVEAADESEVPPDAVANSVAVRGDVVAVAIENDPATDPGWVVFYDIDGEVVTALTVGSLPDMLTFTPDGSTLLVANEGEPNGAYTIDPAGSVSLIDVSGPIADLDQGDVRTAGFGDWDDGTRTLDPDVRVFGPEDEPLVATNLEPEYIVVDDRSREAYVMLQEANAFGVLDVAAGEFTDIVPLGFKDHLLPGNELDVSNRDDEIRIENWPLFGMYQPDGFDAYRWRGQTLLVTANEGDSRDYDGYSEEQRFRSFSDGRDVCEGGRVDQWLDDNARGIGSFQDLRENENLGRLNITNTLGLGDGGCIDEIYNYGARSFSIWTTDGTQLFDSGSDFERIIAQEIPDNFNANNDESGADARSDDKGPEPEDVAIGKVKGRTYAFIGLERVGGIMVYDITDPRSPSFVEYVTNRDFVADPASEEAGDLGPESLIFVEAPDSPTGGPLLVVGNEVSGTTTIFAVDSLTPGNGPPPRR